MAQETQDRECYKCGAPLGQNAQVCRHCHTLQTTFCRKCKHEFRRDLASCPACGTVPLRKRSRAARHRSFYRNLPRNVARFAGEKKRYIIYIFAGLLIGAVARPLITWLAAFSMPSDWLEQRSHRSFTLQHFIEPFWAAGKTLVSWGELSIRSVFQFIWYLVVYYPSGLLMGVIGAVVGFWLAYRKEH